MYFSAVNVRELFKIFEKRFSYFGCFRTGLCSVNAPQMLKNVREKIFVMWLFVNEFLFS